MDRRQGLLGYVAVGLGVVALVVALGGRFGGQYQGFRGYGDYRGPQLPEVAQPQSQAAPQVPVAPQAPVVPQGQQQAQPNGRGEREGGRGYGRGTMQQGAERFGRLQGGREGFERDRRGPFGFLGGLFPLLGALLLMGFGFRLFRGSGRNWRGNGGRGQYGHGPWNGPQQGNGPQGGQPQGGQPQAGPQTPPAPEPPHTGETRRFDA